LEDEFDGSVLNNINLPHNELNQLLNIRHKNDFAIPQHRTAMSSSNSVLNTGAATASAMSTASVNVYVLDPNRRKELIETYIRKPKYSVRRIQLLCEWVNSLHLWHNAVSINSLHTEMCNGLLILR